MNDLNSLIRESFDIIGLLLVFSFVLFDVRYPQIKKELEKDIPTEERRKEREISRKKLQQSLLIHDLPLILINGLFIYLFLPLFLRTLWESNFQLWDFDFVRSAFVIVLGLIFIFFTWSIYLGGRLIMKIFESK